MDEDWFNELHTQPQSPSLPLGFRVEQHEHAPLHANKLDEKEEEEEEKIPLPNQMEEEGDLAVPLDLFNEKIKIISDFVDIFMNEMADEVIDEREEYEPEGEALATEGERLDEELAAEPAPDEELTRERHVTSEVPATEIIAPSEIIIAEEDVPALEPMLQEAAPVLEILEPPIQEPAHEPEATAEEVPPPQPFGQRRDTLRYLYLAITPSSSRPCDHLQSSCPTVGPFANDRESGDINNPQHMDVDAAYFFMLSQDLPLLLGAIIRLGNLRMRIRDFEGFRDWLHVNSDSIVVRIYAGDTDVEIELTKVKS